MSLIIIIRREGRQTGKKANLGLYLLVSVSGVARPKRLGAEVRGSGRVPSGVQGQSPGGGLGAKPPEADGYTQIYSCEKSLFSL